MILLKEIERHHIVEILLLNGTRKKLVERVEQTLLGSTVRMGFDKDNKYALVEVDKGEYGKSYGIAKRCTYSKRADDFKDHVGLSLAVLRALGLSEE